MAHRQPALAPCRLRCWRRTHARPLRDVGRVRKCVSRPFWCGQLMPLTTSRAPIVIANPYDITDGCPGLRKVHIRHTCFMPEESELFAGKEQIPLWVLRLLVCLPSQPERTRAKRIRFPEATSIESVRDTYCVARAEIPTPAACRWASSLHSNRMSLHGKWPRKVPNGGRKQERRVAKYIKNLWLSTRKL